MIGKKSDSGRDRGLGLMALVFAGAISASSADNGNEHGRNQLVGSWELNVDRSPLPPVKSMFTYISDGTLVETGSLATRGPSHGAWEQLTKHQYAVTHVFFRFDPTGTFLGTQRINETVDMAEDGESYSSVAISYLYDTAGNLVVGGLRATITATRIHVEPTRPVDRKDGISFAQAIAGERSRQPESDSVLTAGPGSRYRPSTGPAASIRTRPRTGTSTLLPYP